VKLLLILFLIIVIFPVILYILTVMICSIVQSPEPGFIRQLRHPNKLNFKYRPEHHTVMRWHIQFHPEIHALITVTDGFFVEDVHLHPQAGAGGRVGLIGLMTTRKG
jgi:hypothetical protein